jgi:hypothetical protein
MVLLSLKRPMEAFSSDAPLQHQNKTNATSKILQAQHRILREEIIESFDFGIENFHCNMNTTTPFVP